MKIYQKPLTKAQQLFVVAELITKLEGSATHQQHFYFLVTKHLPMEHINKILSYSLTNGKYPDRLFHKLTHNVLVGKGVI